MPKSDASQELERFFPPPYTVVPWMMSLPCVLFFNIAFLKLSTLIQLPRGERDEA